MDARVRATQGAVAEEPEVTAGRSCRGRGSFAYMDVGKGREQDAEALPGERLSARNVN